MGFSVERTKESVTIYGQKFEIKQPTVRDAIQMGRKAKEAKESGDTQSGMEEMRDWVVSLGVPRDVVEEMETSHFVGLVTYLSTPPDKKKELIAGV